MTTTGSIPIVAEGHPSRGRARLHLVAAALCIGIVAPASLAGAQPDDPTIPPAAPPAAPVPAGPVLRPFDAPPIRVPPPLEAVSPGDEGDLVANLQRRLTELGYWAGPIDGQYSSLTAQAVMAFQKVTEMERSGRADQPTVDALAVAARPSARTLDGDMTEVDKRRQVIFVVRGGTVEWVFNTSTGSGKRYTEIGTSGKPVSGVASTPDGRFAVNREIASGWRISELGQLWRPKYFNGGIAFHGATSVPSYPASHGCVRLTVKAMDFMWDQDYLPKSMGVWVYSD